MLSLTRRVFGGDAGVSHIGAIYSVTAAASRWKKSGILAGTLAVPVESCFHQVVGLVFDNPRHVSDCRFNPVPA